MTTTIGTIELSQSIANVLLEAADNPNGNTFVLVEPRDDDPPERKVVLAAELDEVLELVNAGLLRDISHLFLSQINQCKDMHGFGYMVVQLTPVGMELFSDAKKRKVQ